MHVGIGINQGMNKAVLRYCHANRRHCV